MLPKKRAKKENIPIDFHNLRWESEDCKFSIVKSSKTRLDDRTFARWGAMRTTNPLLGLDSREGDEEDDYEYDFNSPLVSLPDEEIDFVPPVLR